MWRPQAHCITRWRRSPAADVLMGRVGCRAAVCDRGLGRTYTLPPLVPSMCRFVKRIPLHQLTGNPSLGQSKQSNIPLAHVLSALPDHLVVENYRCRDCQQTNPYLRNNYSVPPPPFSRSLYRAPHTHVRTLVWPVDAFRMRLHVGYRMDGQLLDFTEICGESFRRSGLCYWRNGQRWWL